MLANRSSQKQDPYLMDYAHLSSKQVIDELVNDDILQPVSTSAWATPIVSVIKPNGLPRICGDFRLLNKVLKQAATTTRELEDMFEGLQGSKVFSKIDLKNAFLQMLLHEESYELTTINTPLGLYHYRFLPFGLHVSPGLFQNILEDLPGTRAYQDDIIVYASDKQTHDENLLKVLKVLDKHNVCINATKSQYNVSELKYLGFITNGQGISADVERIKALKSAPKPTTPDALRSLLRFSQYYSRFVPNLSDLTLLLYDLLENFKWTPETDQLYNKLVNSLINGKTLSSYEFSLPTQLFVDASLYAIGAVLQQTINL